MKQLFNKCICESLRELKQHNIYGDVILAIRAYMNSLTRDSYRKYCDYVYNSVDFSYDVIYLFKWSYAPQGRKFWESLYEKLGGNDYYCIQ